MTAGEVEILGPEPEPAPRATHRPGFAGWIAALAWTAATALAVVAPFQRLYGSGNTLPRRYADYLPGGSGGVNGWGNGDALGPRFGIALVACAAVCAVLALVAWARMLGAGEWIGRHRVLASGSVAAPCLLAGVIGTMALFLASADVETGWTSYGVSSLHGLGGYVPLHQGETFSSTLAVTFATNPGEDHSWCLWLAVAALACAVAAAVAQSLANRTGRDLAG